MKDISWKIEWSEDLSTPFPEIDSEHRHLIDLINELNIAILDRHEQSAIKEIMNYMIQDTLIHFSNEEQYLTDHGYPDVVEHAKKHAEIANLLEQSIKTFKREKFSYVWIEIGLLIKSTLIDHLLNEDSKYIKYLAIEKMGSS